MCILMCIDFIHLLYMEEEEGQMTVKELHFVDLNLIKLLKEKRISTY